MAAVVSCSGVVWHALPERLEPAAMNQVGEKVPDRTRSQERQNWVLLNRTAHSPAAFTEVAARLGIAVQSLAHVARTGGLASPGLSLTSPYFVIRLGEIGSLAGKVSSTA